ncbi:TPA: hypothetical protein HA338_05800 [Methanosarcina acetivorans]|uniref:Uncharacterized protein n=2 Tax=Methanosarcina acetivorans TaxID=2214 RepID=Q8TNC9_METAC|nr:hypothetical protein [Methanosarcina acetivorans]AAM05749.1 predicted protein [Methanosarcina acetivorans C2A]HIH93556.1 hypothetical protein [Methanosarcina acetivorans]
MNSSEFSEKLDQSFINITSFFQEVASLLRDCDRLMGEEGYTTFNGNTAVYEQSRSVLNPEAWFPAYLSRAYVSEEEAEERSFNRVQFISLYLRYGEGGCHDVKMIGNIPLLVAGIIIPANPKSFRFEGWLTKRWFWVEESEKINALSGDIPKIRVFDVKKGEYNNSKSIKTFAYPLEQVQGTADLKSKIIEKLLETTENNPDTDDPEILA